MDHAYTELVRNRYLDLTDQDIYKIRSEIENMSEMATAQMWKKTFQKIADEYCLSSQYFLIRFLYDNKRIEEKLSMEETGNLSREQVQIYKDKLIEMAKEKEDFDDERFLDLINRAMQNIAKEKKSVLLKREEAMELGHILRFSLDTMQQFLMRVMENEDGIVLKNSQDLIDAYGFLCGLSVQKVDLLKDIYQDIAEDITKKPEEEYQDRFTKELEKSLPEQISKWQESGSDEKRDEYFLEWIEQKSPYLDCPSKTALRIYRNLVAYAYDMISYQMEIPAEDEFLNCIQKITNAPGETSSARLHFYDANGVILDEACESVVVKMLEFDNWRKIGSEESGKLKLTASRKHMISILQGKVYPQKADILQILWFIENMCWNVSKNYGEEDLFNRIADLFDLADDTLRLAMLPEFYPPHLLEQSMLLSVVHSNKNMSPAEVYDLICESLIERRTREAGARKHSKEEKLQAVLELIEAPKDIKKICEKYQVSDKSLYRWKQSYLKTGKI